MALAKIICESCKAEIRPATEIKAVGNDPWCINCYNKHWDPSILVLSPPKGYPSENFDND